ncbi:hypothetical protein FA13DRAFT_1148350 [Coprinellus micaceus]|uniref:Fungal-type protein kinase domain-containing protein n=1 Tax=Coprinellus micaceus TaxID=71717 RepID=A0A4Y7SUY7_COPMI|nr:hypothetical protein FA13DRAFT_1148350 [Coprinellus micaceus]
MAIRSSSNIFGTPRRQAGQREYMNDPTVKGQGKSIMRTMGQQVPRFEYAWAKLKFIKDANIKRSMLQAWLSSDSALFTSGVEGNQDRTRWAMIPEHPTLERQLYTPFFNLITAILNKHLKAVKGIKRRLVDMHAKQMKHMEGHHTSPDLVIQGVGPSFGTPSDGKLVGYTNIVTYFDVKLQRELDRPESLEQMAVYARQIFVHQPNRWFVRCLLLSDRDVQLVHWDRAGLQTSEFYNIHEEYPCFVGLLVSLSNTEGEQKNIGLDDSIQWTHDSAGRKVAGTMTDASSEKGKVFDLIDKNPVSQSHHIHGNATVSWAVRDRKPKVPTQTELFVKDSWSSAGRTEEWKLLARANDAKIKGVCKMIWHKDRRAEISQFRDGNQFFNRVFSRIVMEMYGKEIHRFTSAVQFLAALRDAVAGRCHDFVTERTTDQQSISPWEPLWYRHPAQGHIKQDYPAWTGWGRSRRAGHFD